MSGKVLMAVCTYGRPVMLAKCLDSLAKQSDSPGFSLSIVVVDNEPDENNRAIVKGFAERCRFPVRYRHEPRRGIAFARNAILEEAAAKDVDWIAMLDDDETAAPNWVEALMAPEYLDTPILMGRQIFVYPERMPFWAKPKPLDRQCDIEGIERECAFTNNVRFSISLVSAGLRFREDQTVTCGEDTDFFARAHMQGFGIRQTTRAVTFEEAHPDRYTLIAQVYRSYWESASEINRQFTVNPRGRFYRENAYRIPLTWLTGLGRLLISPFYVIGGLNRMKRRIVSGAKKLGSAAGMSAALFRIQPKPYRKISGY